MEKYKELLVDFGFSDFEAEVYLALLKKPYQTGYSISKKINKTRSSTYLVLNRLQKQGIIHELEERKPRVFIAEKIDRIIQLKEERFNTQKNNITTAFNDFDVTEELDSIYSLRSPEILISKAKELLDKSEKFILIDASDKLLTLLKSNIEHAQERGCNIILESPSDDEFPNLTQVKSNTFRTEQQEINKEWLFLSVDSSTVIISFLESDLSCLSFGIQINNIFLSVKTTYGMFNEIFIRKILNLMQSDFSKEEILDKMQKFYRLLDFNSKGYERFRKLLK